MDAKVRLFRDGVLLKETTGAVGDTLLHCVTSAGEFLDAPCGGRGKCGKCLVQLSPDGEKVKACATLLEGDMDIYLPDEMDEMKIAEEGHGAGASAEGTTGPYGIAVDIGTTTVVAHLTDLPTGKRVATSSGVNAQRTFGADVISRIQYCAANGHEKLTAAIRGQLADLIREDMQKAGVKQEEITYMSVAGNTIMQHLFAGYSPVGMGVVPFTPVSLFGEEIPAGDDMPVAPGTMCFMAPCVHSYVGGDITIGMMACGLDTDPGPVVYLDIGTNGEMGLKDGDEWYVCATAAGPAFEGAEITFGMAAVPGAINHARWTGEKLEKDVIGDVPSTGICGSGLLDMLAVMLENGVVDEGGRLLGADELEGPITDYMGTVDGKNVFFADRGTGVCVTADDVRKLQLAKSAIAAGIQTMMKEADVTEVKSFLLCGGFGSYMDKDSAARMGLFPKEFLPVARTMGNTAGEGAALAVWSEKDRRRVVDLCARCTYIELSTSRTFNDEFIENMMFIPEDEWEA